MKINLLGLFIAMIFVTGCADNINSNHYSTNQTGKASSVVQCTVMNVRVVGVNSDSSAGTLIGGVAGGVAGSTIGSGSSAAALGAVGGALLGGLAGSVAEEKLTSQTGLEYIVKLDNGKIISVTQGTAEALGVGQKCLVIFGSQTRIIAG